jgi:sugar phosphate permease
MWSCIIQGCVAFSHSKICFRGTKTHRRLRQAMLLSARIGFVAGYLVRMKFRSRREGLEEEALACA